MKKYKLDKKSLVIGFLLCLVLLGLTTVYAVNLISSSEISFDNSNTGLSSDNVKDAIEELYGMASNSECPSGYKCLYIGECSYEVGTEWSFTYNKSVQEFKVPCEGLYELEVWGAQGGPGGSSSQVAGGLGGYSQGYMVFNENDSLFIVNGGAGSNVLNSSNRSGGYNGGGGTGSIDSNNYVGTGGGATHIAITNRGELVNYASYKDEVLIVAGGGGGGFSIDNSYNKPGGAGGGLTIGGGGSFGRDTSTGNNAGGGGGWSSGYCGRPSVGGTGYIAGVPSLLFDGLVYNPSSSNGVNTGNGKAKITLIAR